jgi:multidrug resistance efflux pump
MILVLTLAYVALLLLAFKLKFIRPTLFWKLSPIAWVVFLLVALFIPLQFWAPSGYVRILQPTVQIVPNVAGMVTEIMVQANQRVNKGDVLYQIDPLPFQSAVDKLQAELELDTILFKQQKELDKKQLGRKVDLDRTRAKMESTRAQLKAAIYNLEQTTVRAPADGVVTNVEALRAGARVVAAPLRQSMAFVDNSKRIVAAQIQQIHMRYIEPGQPAEIALKMYPGKVYTATVESITPGSALGQMAPTGQLPSAFQEVHGPLFARLKLDNDELASTLPAGATGEVAIYSPKGKPAQIIRKVMIRMAAIKNYIVPN